MGRFRLRGVKDKADLISLAMGVPWHDGDDLPVLEALQGSAGGSIGNRRKQQNFVAFPELLTQGQWARLLDKESTPPDAALQLLIASLVALGGRNLDEYSLKLMNSLWLMLTNPQAMSLSSGQKKNDFQHTKAEFNRVAKAAHKPKFWIQKLPPTPDALMKEYV